MKVLKVMASLPVFYLLYILLYFVGDISAMYIYGYYSSYFLAIFPAILCFAYIFSLSHITIIKITGINRYFYIIVQLLLISCFVYMKTNSFLHFGNSPQETDFDDINTKLNSYIYATELILSAVAVAMTLSISSVWKVIHSDIGAINDDLKMKIVQYFLLFIVIMGVLCLGILAIIILWNWVEPSGFFSWVLFIMLLPELPIVFAPLILLAKLWESVVNIKF